MGDNKFFNYTTGFFPMMILEKGISILFFEIVFTVKLELVKTS